MTMGEGKERGGGGDGGAGYPEWRWNGQVAGGARAWDSDIQGVEAPMPLALAQKDTQKGK